MYSKAQAKLYYLYMMSDGDVSENEKKLFNSICKDLYLDADDKKEVLKECKNIASEDGMNCIEVLEKNADTDYIMGDLDLDLSKYVTEEDKAKILWNLIKLGYSDEHFTTD